MNENYKEVAWAFIEQYNLIHGTHYKFECLRKSMFSIPKYKFPAFEIYQMAFIEGKKRSAIVADLMVLLRLQKRLIIEVVEPHLAQELKATKRTLPELTYYIEHIVDPIEKDASSVVVCSKYLLVDARGFGYLRIDNPETYKASRLEYDKEIESLQDKSRYEEWEIKQTLREYSLLGMPTKRWFKEIWLLYHDEKGVGRCLQIW